MWPRLGRKTFSLTLHQQATPGQAGKSVPGPDRASCDEHRQGHGTVVATNRWGQEPDKNKAEPRDSEADRWLWGHLCISHSKMVMLVKFQHGWRPWNHCDVIQVTLEGRHTKRLCYAM